MISLRYFIPFSPLLLSSHTPSPSIPRRSSDPESPSYFPPSRLRTVLAFIFITIKIQNLLPPSTRIELYLNRARKRSRQVVSLENKDLRTEI